MLIAYCNTLNCALCILLFCFVDEMVEIEGVPQLNIATTTSITDTTNDDHIVKQSEDTVTESDATTKEDMHTDDCTTAGTADVVITNAIPDGQCNFASNSISALSG